MNYVTKKKNNFQFRLHKAKKINDKTTHKNINPLRSRPGIPQLL